MPVKEVIHLSRMEINSAGPISSFQARLAPLTLVYAPNERGKTTIVENLIYCLFRRKKEGLHSLVREDFLGTARVTVEGVAEKPLVFAFPSKGRKIEDLLEVPEWNFPPNLFDLLVVRGAEVELLNQRGSPSRSYLKTLFSRERLFETLRDRLPAEVGYTKFENGVLAGKRLGLFKTYKAAGERLATLEKVADRFYGSLSRTELLHGLSRKTALETERSKLQLAKRHTAYLTQRSITGIQEELERFDENQAESLSAAVRDYLRVSAELAAQDEQNRERKKTVADLHWLEQARKRYEHCLGRRRNPLQLLSFIGAGLSLAGVLIVYFFAPAFVPVFLAFTGLTLAAGMLFTYVRGGGGSPESAAAEIREIKKAFRTRFATALLTLADFDHVKSGLDRELGKAQALEEKQRIAHNTLNALREQIDELLLAAGQAHKPGQSSTPDSRWPDLAEELKSKTNNLRNTLNRYQERLENLGVDEVDYLEQKPEIEYSRQREEEVTGELQEVEQNIGEQKETSRTLREELIEHIGREATRSQNIESLAESIENKRQEYKNQIRDCLAQMIAGHVVAEVLESYRSLEDRQLKSTLNDPRITGLVRNMTGGRYDRLSLEGDELLIENEAESYALSRMSSGAREQVLLALRMGLASIVCRKKSLFLILDDAFQYSDWQRREALVLQAADAVTAGWQVIYLTMDDDIRDRFCKAAETLDQGSFALIEL